MSRRRFARRLTAAMQIFFFKPCVNGLKQFPDPFDPQSVISGVETMFREAFLLIRLGHSDYQISRLAKILLKVSYLSAIRGRRSLERPRRKV
jgi:hypothetical protein